MLFLSALTKFAPKLRVGRQYFTNNSLTILQASIFYPGDWRQGSNLRPPAPKVDVLTTTNWEDVSSQCES